MLALLVYASCLFVVETAAEGIEVEDASGVEQQLRFFLMADQKRKKGSFQLFLSRRLTRVPTVDRSI